VSFSSILAEMKFVFILIDGFSGELFILIFVKKNIFHLMFWKIDICRFYCKSDRKNSEQSTSVAGKFARLSAPSIEFCHFPPFTKYLSNQNSEEN